MYSESDLSDAVDNGVFNSESADRFREFIASRRDVSVADEEQFRLLTGFNDIFVSVALVLVLVPVAWLGVRVALSFCGMTVAASSWVLAEFFTRKRRMALPSILLLLTFVGGVFVASVTFNPFYRLEFHNFDWRYVAASAALASIGAWVHWRRFKVPITVSVGAGMAFLCVYLVLVALLPALATNAKVVLIPLGGLAMFVTALWWDASDGDCMTRRSDVAFWLHLVSAPMLIHPAYTQLLVKGYLSHGVSDLIAVSAYTSLAIIALALDRRAILITALAYVLWATQSLTLFVWVSRKNDYSLSEAFAGLVVGCALLLLSVFWQPVRRLVVGALPHRLQKHLPPARKP